MAVVSSENTTGGKEKYAKLELIFSSKYPEVSRNIRIRKINTFYKEKGICSVL